MRGFAARAFWALVACAAAPAFVSPQTPANQRPTFASRSDLVVVHTTVLDRRGFVSGLEREAFAVFEDDKLQKVTLFSNVDSPATVGMVIDNSGSMQPKRDAVIAAGLAFARASHPQDEMFTINFNDRVWPGLPARLPFTSDLDALRAALSTVHARGQTMLYDALDTAMKHLGRGAAPKKVLVVVSDGGDNASRTSLASVLSEARQQDAVIYAVGIFDDLDDDARPDVLKQLARDTGGEAYFPKRVEDTVSILERIAREIRSGYTLGYVPADTALDGRYRRLRVVVNAPGRRGLKVRARAGYLAPSRTSVHVP